MWHITTAEVFTNDNQEQPVAVIRREAGGKYAVEIQPDRELPPSFVTPSEDGTFETFNDALTFCEGA